MGGTVKRHVNKKTQKSHLEKSYFDPYSLQNDVVALSILEQINSSLKNSPVDILQPQKVMGDEHLIFKDVRGYALDRLSPSHTKEQLQKKILLWAQAVFNKVQQLPNFETHFLEDSGFYWISYRPTPLELPLYNNLSVVDILLKPDNIIYDTVSGRMTLFDPY